MQEATTPPSGLTPEERLIMDRITRAWGHFASLPGHLGDDLADFRRATHELQRILAVRALRRQFPEYWGGSD